MMRIERTVEAIGTGIVRDAVGVDAQRAAHGENIDGLHGFDGEALRVQEELHLLPGGAGLDVQDLVLFVEAKLVEAAHVEDHAVLDEALAAHAVTLAGGGDFQVVIAGEL